MVLLILRVEVPQFDDVVVFADVGLLVVEVGIRSFYLALVHEFDGFWGGCCLQVQPCCLHIFLLLLAEWHGCIQSID